MSGAMVYRDIDGRDGSVAMPADRTTACLTKEALRQAQDSGQALRQSSPQPTSNRGRPVCYRCGRDFANPGLLARHMKRVHS